MANALRIQLQPSGWQVLRGRKLAWPVGNASSGIGKHFPGMQTDIELVHFGQKVKLVIDTKFTHIFTSSQYKTDLLKSGYLYQLYAYLRTQEEHASYRGIERSEGMLLHPQCGQAIDEYVDIQGHRMRFKTIDLKSIPEKFEWQLLHIRSEDEYDAEKIVEQ